MQQLFMPSLYLAGFSNDLWLFSHSVIERIFLTAGYSKLMNE